MKFTERILKTHAQRVAERMQLKAHNAITHFAYLDKDSKSMNITLTLEDNFTAYEFYIALRSELNRMHHSDDMYDDIYADYDQGRDCVYLYRYDVALGD